jgi:hypothetical protein
MGLWSCKTTDKRRSQRSTFAAHILVASDNGGVASQTITVQMQSYGTAQRTDLCRSTWSEPQAVLAAYRAQTVLCCHLLTIQQKYSHDDPTVLQVPIA